MVLAKKVIGRAHGMPLWHIAIMALIAVLVDAFDVL